MALGVLAFSAMGVAAKSIGPRLPLFEFVAARATITLGMSLYALRGREKWGQSRGLLVARGVFGFVALCCFFYSLTHLPLAEATLLQFTNPVLTAGLAALLLGERLGAREMLGVGVCVLGVILVARPAFLFGADVAIDPVAVVVGLVGATFSAMAYITVRRLGAAQEDPLVVVFYFSAVTFVGAVSLLFVDAPVMPQGHEWLALLGVGVFAQLGQIELTKGLRTEPAGRAASLNYGQVVLAYGFGLLFFGEVPTALGLTGTALVMAGTFLIVRGA